jgi:hypothetical protein
MAKINESPQSRAFNVTIMAEKKPHALLSQPIVSLASTPLIAQMGQRWRRQSFFQAASDADAVGASEGAVVAPLHIGVAHATALLNNSGAGKHPILCKSLFTKDVQERLLLSHILQSHG